MVLTQQHFKFFRKIKTNHANPTILFLWTYKNITHGFSRLYWYHLHLMKYQYKLTIHVSRPSLHTCVFRPIHSEKMICRHSRDNCHIKTNNEGADKPLSNLVTKLFVQDTNFHPLKFGLTHFWQVCRLRSCSGRGSVK